MIKVPSYVAQNKKLNGNDKLLFSVLLNGNLGLSNEQYSKLLGVTYGMIGNSMQKLRKLGYINIKYLNRGKTERKISILGFQ